MLLLMCCACLDEKFLEVYFSCATCVYSNKVSQVFLRCQEEFVTSSQKALALHISKALTKGHIFMSIR